MRLEQALADVAFERDPHLAISVVGGGAYTYGELHARAQHYAAALQDSGVVAGDRVGIVSRHDAEAIALFWGVLTAGAIVVWMNDDAKGKDLPAICTSADPKLVVVQGEKQARLFANNDEICERVMELEVLARMSVLPPEPVNGTDDDPAVIVYTSGSSGQPKGVCLSHKNLYTVDRAVIEHMPITPDDIYMMVVPLHYVHGVMQLTVHLLAGATIHFHDSFLFPTQVVDALINLRCTGFSGVPFHFNALVTRGSLLDRDLPDLRWVTVTGGKLPSDAIMTILDRFPELEFHIAYGQTECAPRATALHPSRVRAKPDSVGSPIPGVRVEILG
ncbi:MAG: AMP-binding protein, partial [Pseudomonadota bacterium]